MIKAEKAYIIAMGVQAKPVKKNVEDAIKEAAKKGLFSVDVIIPRDTSLRSLYKDLIDLKYTVSVTDKNCIRISWKNYLLR